jgi:hypothetical protein
MEDVNDQVVIDKLLWNAMRVLFWFIKIYSPLNELILDFMVVHLELSPRVVGLQTLYLYRTQYF